MGLAASLYDIIEVIGPLWEEVTDTYMAVGAEAFAAGRVFYKSFLLTSYFLLTFFLSLCFFVYGVPCRGLRG